MARRFQFGKTRRRLRGKWECQAGNGLAAAWARPAAWKWRRKTAAWGGVVGAAAGNAYKSGGKAAQKAVRHNTFQRVKRKRGLALGKSAGKTDGGNLDRITSIM